MLSQAYKARSYETAKKTLKALVSWLDSNGEPDHLTSLHGHEGFQVPRPGSSWRERSPLGRAREPGWCQP